MYFITMNTIDQEKLIIAIQSAETGMANIIKRNTVANTRRLNEFIKLQKDLIDIMIGYMVDIETNPSISNSIEYCRVREKYVDQLDKSLDLISVFKTTINTE